MVIGHAGFGYVLSVDECVSPRLCLCSTSSPHEGGGRVQPPPSRRGFGSARKVTLALTRRPGHHVTVAMTTKGRRPITDKNVDGTQVLYYLETNNSVTVPTKRKQNEY